jgi:DNA-3-methyladenine glycosylase I
MENLIIHSSLITHHFFAKIAGMPKRCDWARTDLSIAYHDTEWGVPVHDDGKLFEFLILEGAQAGLSWEIILNKRAGYRAAFSGFDPAKVARYGDRERERLLQDPRIVRNRLKIAAAIQNAKAFLAVREEFGSFDRYIWQFVDGVPRKRKRGQGVPTYTVQSDAMSKDLGRRGFKFVGTTICYAFMQAVGMVNDHNHSCFRFREIS